MTNKSISNQFLSIKQQSGYLMLMVAVFLLVLMAGSAQYFTRETDNIKTSGTLRDSTESVMLAESAMELVRGQFIGTMDTVTETPNVLDNVAGAALAPNKASPDTSLFSYMYYVTAGAGLDQTQPTILQLVADGETIAQTAAALTARNIATGVTRIRVNDMFATVSGVVMAPFLFTLDSSGVLISSTATSWAGETGSAKAAVWIEVLENSSDASAVDLFVEAVAQVGNAKSYVQRYIGTYNNVLGSVSILAEASNLDRSGP